MKHLSLLFVLCIQFALYGQKTAESKKELQTKSEQFTQQFITLIEKKDHDALKKLTASRLYCYLCFETAPENPPVVDRNTFYAQHVNQVFNKDLLERLKRNEIKFSVDRDQSQSGSRDYIVLYTTYRPNEFEKGHEGAQFIFWLKDEKGALKLSGVETVP